MDVQHNSEQVNFRDFLEESLQEACTSAPKDVETLEERCLAAVLPICDTAETKKLLNRYCAPVSNEVQRYAPKVNAFNHILRELENLDAQSTGGRIQEPIDVIFHRNDPKSMKAHRNDMDTNQKPDAILARKEVMIDSQNGRNLDSENASLNPFHRHIPMPTEYKRVKNVLRVVRVIHHKELSSLRNGEHLLSGWRDCFECHYALWKGGIEHGDVGLHNLMWDPFLKVGVLNDFDLTNVSGEDSKGGRRTGTITFIALQLIKPGMKNPQARRLYRHDVESLIWVLIWICLYFIGPDDIPQGMEEDDVREHISLLQEWKTGDTRRAFQVRAAFLDSRHVPCKAYKELWNLTEKLGTWVTRRNFDEIVENLNPRDCAEEVEVTHKRIVDIIKDYDYAHKSATEKLVTNDRFGPSSWP